MKLICKMGKRDSGRNLPVRESTNVCHQAVQKRLIAGYDSTGLPMSGAPNGNFRENICSEDDLRSRIFGAFVVKFLACLLS